MTTWRVHASISALRNSHHRRHRLRRLIIAALLDILKSRSSARDSLFQLLWPPPPDAAASSIQLQDEDFKKGEVGATIAINQEARRRLIKASRWSIMRRSRSDVFAEQQQQVFNACGRVVFPSSSRSSSRGSIRDEPPQSRLSLDTLVKTRQKRRRNQSK